MKLMRPSTLVFLHLCLAVTCVAACAREQGEAGETAADSSAAVRSSFAAQAEAAVDALCNEWRYDPNLSIDANEASLRDLAESFEHNETTADIQRQAWIECPENFEEFWAAREIVQNQEREAAASEYSQRPVPQPTPTRTPGNGGASQPTTVGSPELRNYLAGRGVDDSLVRQLGAMADITGYGLSPGNPLPFEQAQGFAVAIIDRCDEVSSGQITWSDAVNEDVGDGAPVSDAQQMNSYLQSTFCPRVY
ncbi:hypothetical protein [Blastococcus sp. SYSU DS1024]